MDLEVRGTKKQALLNSFDFKNFRYCPLFCLFTSSKRRTKILKNRRRLELNNSTGDHEDFLNHESI